MNKSVVQCPYCDSIFNLVSPLLKQKREVVRCKRCFQIIDCEKYTTQLDMTNKDKELSDQKNNEKSFNHKKEKSIINHMTDYESALIKNVTHIMPNIKNHNPMQSPSFHHSKNNEHISLPTENQNLLNKHIDSNDCFMASAKPTVTFMNELTRSHVKLAHQQAGAPSSISYPGQLHTPQLTPALASHAAFPSPPPTSSLSGQGSFLNSLDNHYSKTSLPRQKTSHLCDENEQSKPIWPLVVLMFLIGLLLSQYIYFNFYKLYTAPATHFLISYSCQHLGCMAPDFDAFNVISSDIKVTNSIKNSGHTLVSFKLTNIQQQQQPFPAIRFATQLSNHQSAVILVQPREYLNHKQFPGKHIQPKSTINGSFEIKLPQASIGKFSLTPIYWF